MKKMKINELLNLIEKNLIDEDFKGDFIIFENSIVWSYAAIKSMSDIDDINTYDDDLLNFQFESDEEVLNDVYLETLDNIELFLDEINQLSSLSLSEPITKNGTISFTISY